MGNSDTLPSRVQSLNSQNWVEAGQDQQNAIFSNVNPYRRRLLANILTQELIQQYQLNFITEQDFNSYLSELTYRQAASSGQSAEKNEYSQSLIYPIRYFVNKSKHQMCTTIHTGYLYADKVELRLKEINDIPFQDLLYMYKATLNGFKLLYQKVGYFDILEQMIFITKTGQVQVWMNPNLAKNYPNYQKTTYNSSGGQTSHSQRQPQHIYGSQADMIRKLILMIQKNSDQFIDSTHNPPQNQLFSQFLQQKHIFDKLSFQHSLDQFQNYLSKNNLHCPDFMRSIPELFSPDQININNPNYEQSHVNQITSQHLTQMKRKYQPMQTILEDDHANPKTINKLQHFNQRPPTHLLQSHPILNTPHPFSNQRPTHQTSQPHHYRKNPLPSKSPFTDLNNSKHSHQSNQIPSNDYTHLQKTSKSYANNHLNIKPNSGSALSFNNGQSQIGSGFKSQPYFGVINNPNVVVLPPPQNSSHGHFAPQHPHFHGHYVQQNNTQRMVMVSPPPSFRIMNPVSNASFQHQVIHPNHSSSLNPQNHLIQQNHFNPQNNLNQPISLPPPGSFPGFKTSYQPLNPSNRGFSQHQYEVKDIKRLTPQKRVVHLNQGTASNEKKIPSGSKQVQLGKSHERQLGKESNISQNFRKEHHRNDEKYKVKYFTKNDSYQLDQEIANDLQKFLGLKVN